jgi:serine/threonine protein kinase
MPDSGFVAGRYRLVRKIGSGGMGFVWLARDEVLHRDVAIKEVILPTGLSEAEQRDQIDGTLREARAAGRLSHPNVIQVYDVVMFEERPWIIMEYVPSRSLYQVVREDGPLPARRVAEIGLLVLAALQAAHKARVWHRDVKPGNVLLAKDGRVVLTDFGLATFEGDGGVTRSGLILGSAQYIAPERARDGASGPEADMWSLGATLYAAVEGRSPYARESAMATLTALATQPPDTPRRAGPLRAVLLGLLRKNPRHRLTASEAEKLLRAVANGEIKARSKPPRQLGRALAGGRDAEPPPGAVAASSSPASPPTGENSTRTQETYEYPRSRRRRWPWVATTAALAVALVGTAVALADRGSPAGTKVGPSTTTPQASQSPTVTTDMGVQACVYSPPSSGVPVTGKQSIPTAPDAAPEGWVYYQDTSQTHIAVPDTWRVWRVGQLLCFRDPYSSVAAAILFEGPRGGSTAALLRQDESGWVRAAGLHNYDPHPQRSRTLGDEATEFEYTYTAAGGTTMHGVNLLLRIKGAVYLLCLVGAESLWSPYTQDLRGVFQVSFGLDR